MSWLQVFRSVTAVHLPHGAGREREMTTVQSEKYVARCGSTYDDMRMSTASFVRVLQRCTGSLYMHFLLILHEVRAVRNTCNQFIPSAPDRHAGGSISSDEMPPFDGYSLSPCEEDENAATCHRH